MAARSYPSYGQAPDDFLSAGGFEPVPVTEDTLESVFTEDAMNRPIFEEPGDESERADAWSGPHGFMIGGEYRPPLNVLGQQFFEAAYVLAESIIRGDAADYRIANPVLYLYRHSIELLLKSFMGSTRNTHDLSKLADEFAIYVKEKHREDLAPWILARLKELATLDPNSTAFRYAENYDRESKKHIPVDGELYVSLPHLQDAMVALNYVLTGTIAEVARANVEQRAR